MLTDGPPIAAAELQIARDDGELLVVDPRSASATSTRHDNADAFTTDGWFRTGDLATVDDDGADRRSSAALKDVIIRGGENISTAEVEAALEAHPVDPPGRRGGLSRCAHGRTRCGVRRRRRVRSTSTRRREWFAERGVAKYKTPERVLVVSALPLLATGKPDRVALTRCGRPRVRCRRPSS